MKSPAHIAKVNKWRQWPLMICGLASFGMGLYAVMIYVSLTEEVEVGEVPDDLSDRFDKEAEGYDEKVNLAETMLRLTSRRKQMTQKATGHVLEVAVGTGRNIPYYPTKQCATVTLLDSSAPMLAVAKRKWKDTHPEYFSRTFFKQQSAIDPITPPHDAQAGFDTVIQTMGLCSTPEPVKLLHSLEAATNEETGQILLLEHGKSHYEWLNNFLDQSAPNHALTHGCWWNKDIGKIVEESGLEVVDIKRYNFGTTWWVELKPRKGMRKQFLEKAQELVGVGKAEDVPVVQQRSWWKFWG
jgi:methyltransferase OMS1